MFLWAALEQQHRKEWVMTTDGPTAHRGKTSHVQPTQWKRRHIFRLIKPVTWRNFLKLVVSYGRKIFMLRLNIYINAYIYIKSHKQHLRTGFHPYGFPPDGLNHTLSHTSWPQRLTSCWGRKKAPHTGFTPYNPSEVKTPLRMRDESEMSHVSLLTGSWWIG